MEKNKQKSANKKEDVKKAISDLIGKESGLVCECGGETIVIAAGATIEPYPYGEMGIPKPTFTWEYQCKVCGKTHKVEEK